MNGRDYKPDIWFTSRAITRFSSRDFTTGSFEPSHLNDYAISLIKAFHLAIFFKKTV